MALPKYSLSKTSSKWFGIAFISVFFFSMGFFAGKINDSQVPSSEIKNSTLGSLAISESQLVDAVASSGEVVYWAGSKSGTRYSLDMSKSGASYVTYLAPGSGDASNAENLVVATYYREDAFQATFDAGTLENGVSILRDDESSVVYYNTSLPTNVYLAFKDKPYQIEVYDPEPGKALAIASEIGRIRPIN